jgi:hypothetical protein
MVAVRMLYSHFCRGDFRKFVVDLKRFGFSDVSVQQAFDLTRADIDESYTNEK